MPRKPAPREHIHYHKDGSVWAKGQMLGDVMVGYWEWFRKDGTKLRSGYLDNGEQIGEWTTYDAKGNVFKVTTIKPKASKKVAATTSNARKTPAKKKA